MDVEIELIWRPALACLLMAITAGPLGCFVVWKQMAYFGDSLAHSALLGVALALLASLNVNAGAALICALFSLLLAVLQRRGVLALDTLLGILAHGALALGMVAASFLKDIPFDPEAYLFGDVLAVSNEDIFLLASCAVLSGFTLLRHKESLLLLTLDADLAKAEGVNQHKLNTWFLALMTVTAASSLRVTGVLLFTSMLIIPAATARVLSRSPEGMAIGATLLAGAGALIGVVISLYVDTPTAPSAVAASALLFAGVTITSAVAKTLFRRGKRS